MKCSNGKTLTGLVDLHIHTTASDGSDAPAEVVRKAHKLGLEAIAITDHDNIDGVEEAKAEGARVGQEVISGCELAAETPYGEMHIIALWVTLEHQAMNELLEMQREMRESRNWEILLQMERVGIFISGEELFVESGCGRSIGRPHIAKAILRKGFAHSVQDAFRRYLLPGKPGYVPRKLLTPEEVMGIAKKAGATTIIAHPMSLPASPEWIKEEAARLASLGVLDGIEAYHPEHDAFKVKYVESFAADLGLFLSGGSDYHGAVKPKIELGRGEGKLRVPVDLLNEIKRRRKQLALPV